MLVQTYSGSILGIDAHIITIETFITKGIQFAIVGLADSAIRESQQRIDSALKHNGLKIPRQSVTINMAPADLKKEGAGYDLALTIGILAADGKINDEKLSAYIILGELSLEGKLRPVKGVLPICIEAKRKGFKGVVLPKNNIREASLLKDFDIIGVNHFKDAIAFFNVKYAENRITNTPQSPLSFTKKTPLDFKDVKGQQKVKRAFEIAAAGHHNLIMIGPPGVGKTMLAKRLPSILPPLCEKQMIDSAKIHSIAGAMRKQDELYLPSFRSPHHTISDVALVGGGVYPKPGEISLAHHGILFLDELPEFKKSVLEVLRQPLEEHEIHLSRAKYSAHYPARFIFVASMNPCPCGYYNHPSKACTCNPFQIKKYVQKISGPLLDRIDLHVEVSPVETHLLFTKAIDERYTSKKISERITKAREIQRHRFKTMSTKTNAHLSGSQIESYCKIDTSCKKILQQVIEKLDLSARAYNKILKVARTIADLEESDSIVVQHLTEAIGFRSLDKGSWGD